MNRARVQRPPAVVALRPVIRALLGSLLLCGSARAEPLTVSAGQAPTSLAGYVEFLEDPESRFRFEEVSSRPLVERFRANTSGRELNFGNTRSTYWFRFSLANPGEEPVDLLLEVGFPQLDQIELYRPQPGGGFRSTVLGDRLPFHQRIFLLRDFVLPLRVPAGATTTYYLRVQTAGTLSVPLLVSAIVPYLERTHGGQLLLGLSYGIFLGAALYNLFLFFSLREAVYLYLVGHILSLGLGLACIDGLAFQIWPTATGWHQWAVYVFICSVSIFTILFVRRFVSTAETSPGLDRVLKGALWAQVGSCSLVALWGARAFFRVAVLWIMVVGAVLAFTVFWHAARGHRAARIYAFAWGLLLLVMVYAAAASFALVPSFVDSVDLVRVAGAVEVLLAAIAVAANLNETRQALAASESKFSHAFLSNPDAVVISTFDEGRLIEVNAGFETLSGYRREEVLGVSAAELGIWEPGFRERMLARLRRDGRVREMEAIMVDKSGESIPVLVSNAVIELEGLRCLVGILRDVTERKLAAEQRDRLIRQLEAKNAELERFTYTVSHDLKAPLVTIGGFLGLLEKDALAGDTKRLRHDIERIQSASRKLRRLLDELLELSRIGRVVNRSQAVSLTELAREAASLVADPLRKKRIDLDISPDLPVVFGDRVRLLEVLQNLLDNAVRYLGDPAEPRIEIGRRRDGDEIVCFVRDNGIGIDPCYHGKVFELFERLDSGTDGTGIGLALVKRIVEFHSGRIWIESQGEGTGSAFCFVIPPGETPS